MREPSHAVAALIVFFTSFCVLAFEINFTRVFAYAQWHNLSSVVITMALMGFGISGSTIALAKRKIENDFPLYLYSATLLFPVLLCVGFIITTQLDFNPYEMTFNPSIVLSMILYFCLMGVGFFLGASIICLSILRYKISFIYFVNLAGSAGGVVFVLVGAYFAHPIDLMVVIILISLVPGVLTAMGQSMKITSGVLVSFLLTVSILLTSWAYLDVKQVSQYKAISTALTLPGAKVVHEAYSPFGVLQVVQAGGLRSHGGLSLICPFQVPIQKVIYLNGEGASPIIPFTGTPEDVLYLKYTASYFPFYMADSGQKEKLLIIGSGGGSSIFKAFLAGFKQVDALEANPDVIHLMTKKFGHFSGHIYNHKNVNPINQEARTFIRHTKNKYDLIELSLLDSYSTAASGVYGLNESYLYTVEAVKEYLERLRPGGMLAVTRWIMTPPRDNLKLINTVARAFEETTGRSAGNHLILVRSLQTLTLVAVKNRIPPDYVVRAKTFARDRLFDLVWYPGMEPEEANRHIKLQIPVYYQAVKELTGSSPQSFVDEYAFDISAPTDNRPYFYNFFRFRVISLIKTFGALQIPVTEWGYFLLVIILIPVLVFSFAFILFPLIMLKEFPQGSSAKVFLYFSLIGAGFFFIEMPLIQKMILFLGRPVYSISIIIASLLVFSGIGSYFSGRIFHPRTRIVTAAILIAAMTFINVLYMDDILAALIHLGALKRFGLTILFISPLGFLMGIPFPAGLESIRGRDSGLTAWAWGINGFFSVTSILVSTLMAVAFGFKTVLISAAVFYLLAAISYRFGFDENL